MFKESKIIGYDGIRAGVLYSVSQGGIKEYNPNRCYLKDSYCSSSCKLFVNGDCLYKNSLLRDLLDKP